MIEFGGGSPGDIGLQVKQVRELGYKGRLQNTAIGGAVEIVKIAGKKFSEDMYIYSPVDFESPSYLKLTEQYEKKYKTRKINVLMPSMYDGASMTFAAIEKAGSLDPEKIARALETITPYEGIRGKMKWGGKEVYGIDHQIYGPTFIERIHDGKEEIVERIYLD